MPSHLWRTREPFGRDKSLRSRAAAFRLLAAPLRSPHAHTDGLASQTPRPPPPPSVVTREQRPRRRRSVPSGGSQLSRWPNPYQRSTWLHCQLPIRLVKKSPPFISFFFFPGREPLWGALHDPPTSRYSSARTKSRLQRDESFWSKQRNK